IDSGDIAPYLIMSGISLPRLAEGLSLNATANLYATPEGVSIEGLQGSAEDNEFSGTLGVDRNAEALRFSGELALASIDFGWLAETVYGPVTEPLTGQLSRIRIPKAAGLPVNIDLALTTGLFRLGALGDIKDFKTTLKSDRGKIELVQA